MHKLILQLDASPQRRQFNDCVPGTTWNDGCNNCFCTENGLAGCTLLECSRINVGPSTAKPTLKGYFTEAETRNPRFRCEPNTKVKVDCNTCGCDKDGKISWCTKIGCSVGKK